MLLPPRWRCECARHMGLHHLNDAPTRQTRRVRYANCPHSVTGEAGSGTSLPPPPLFSYRASVVGHGEGLRRGTPLLRAPVHVLATVAARLTASPLVARPGFSAQIGARSPSLSANMETSARQSRPPSGRSQTSSVLRMARPLGRRRKSTKKTSERRMPESRPALLGWHANRVSGACRGCSKKTGGEGLFAFVLLAPRRP